MINIPKLLPVVRKEFPNIPLPKLLKAMQDFAQAHPDLTDEQAVQAFEAALKQTRAPQQPQPPFQGLINSMPTGVK